jgi:hypothetical protein
VSFRMGNPPGLRESMSPCCYPKYLCQWAEREHKESMTTASYSKYFNTNMLTCSRPQFKSPYYKESHRVLQKAMRLFTDKELYPVAQDCEKTGKHIPQELIDSMSEKGILHMRIGPGEHMHGVSLMNGAVSTATGCCCSV